jgi:hypothetical protein
MNKPAAALSLLGLGLTAVFTGCGTLDQLDRSLAVEHALTPYKRMYHNGQISRLEYKRHKERIESDPYLRMKWNVPDELKRNDQPETLITEAAEITEPPVIDGPSPLDDQTAAGTTGIEALPLAQTYPLETEATFVTEPVYHQGPQAAEAPRLSIPAAGTLTDSPSAPVLKDRYPKIRAYHDTIGPKIEVETGIGQSR